MTKLILSCMTLALLPCSAADTGRLKTEVNPGRAGVFVDGKYLGPAANFKIARTCDVAAGDHEVRLVDPRYEEIVTRVTIVAGKKTILHEVMKELPPAKPSGLMAVVGNKPIPFTVGGTSSDPVFKPDYGDIAKEEIKSVEGDVEKAGRGLLNGLLGRGKKN